jgi:Fur family ferric uptake transcriptional regulator
MPTAAPMSRVIEKLHRHPPLAERPQRFTVDRVSANDDRAPLIVMPIDGDQRATLQEHDNENGCQMRNGREGGHRMIKKSRHTPSEPSHDASAEAKSRLAAHLERSGLNHSRVRDAVVDAFLAAPGHVSVEELTAIVRRRGPAVGYSTVYRTMKPAECGVAAPHDFGDGQTRYERALEKVHHDHLICTECGAILEFEDHAIEELQEAVARRHGFEVTSHKTELYGRCAVCAIARRSHASAHLRVRAGRIHA